MKIRMTVEYDPDCTIDPRDTTKVNALLDREKEFWMNQELYVYDVEETGGTVKFELIE